MTVPFALSSPQALLDTVRAHAKAQPFKSEANGQCLYRGPKGAKCFIGAAIPDEMYKPSFDVRVDSGAEQVLPEIGVEDADVISLAVDLQEVHDYEYPAYWQAAIARIAEKRGLNR